MTGIRVGVTLVEDESRHLGTLLGQVDLDYDADYQSRVGEPFESGEDLEIEVILEEVASEEHCTIGDLLEDFGKHMPKIRLDNGQIVFGFECWWKEVTPEEEAVFLTLPNPKYG